MTNIIEIGQNVINIEINELKKLTIDKNFVAACELIMSRSGRVIIIGMGKSGHIGKKIAATMASTGTPAFFVHPGEASHGDLGMITADDTTVMISNSGEADEILLILPILKRLNIPVISMTGNPKSSLATNADINLDIGVNQEACPLNLAPTSSTTNTLVMGDALAITLLKLQKFTKEDFAKSHPAGSLGKKLLIKIKDIMHSGDELPIVLSKTTFSDALIEMSSKRLGMLAIVDNKQKVLGIFTDGDLRRALNNSINIEQTIIDDYMTTKFITSSPNILAESALQLMEQKSINGLLITDSDNMLLGAINMLDLVRAKII